jgi:hypothetical protein
MNSYDEKFTQCYQGVYWWDGEYEGNCILRADHPPGLHWDGMSWYNDDNEQLYDLPDDLAAYIQGVYAGWAGWELARARGMWIAR